MNSRLSASFSIALALVGASAVRAEEVACSSFVLAGSPATFSDKNDAFASIRGAEKLRRMAIFDKTAAPPLPRQTVSKSQAILQLDLWQAAFERTGNYEMAAVAASFRDKTSPRAVSVSDSTSWLAGMCSDISSVARPGDDGPT
jgi:hypothetical protein